MKSGTKYRKLIVASACLALLIGAYATFQLAIQSLKDSVVAALKPYGEVAEVRLGLGGIELMDVRLRPTENAWQGTPWPTDNPPHAARILIVPALPDLLIGRLTIQRLRIENAQTTLLRSRDGHIRAVPEATGAAPRNVTPATAPSAPGAARTAITIVRTEIVDGRVDFIDETIRKPPHILHFEKIDVVLGRLQWPALTGQSPITLSATLKGIRQDGNLSITGYLEPAARELGLSTRWRGIDLLVLQPYLIKAGERGFQKGTLDLDIKPSLRKRQLHAPGTLTLSELELAGGSPARSILGMPSNVAIALLKNNQGRISTKFLLEGDIDDPRFSLNESMNTRLAFALAKMLGVSFESLIKGIGSIGSGTLRGLGKPNDTAE